MEKQEFHPFPLSASILIKRPLLYDRRSLTAVFRHEQQSPTPPCDKHFPFLFTTAQAKEALKRQQTEEEEGKAKKGKM
jgi:hypothetical protein